MKIKTKQMTVRTQRSKRGFTLVEIMLVVVIIGILAALVIPKIAGNTERARVTAAQADINGGIKSALGQYEVTIDPAVAERARAAVQRMIDLPPPAVPARYDLVKARHHVDVELI